MGGRRDEARRPRERPHREGHGAEVGARQRERGDRRAGAARRWSCSASATASARRATALQAEVLVVHSVRGARGARRRRRADASCCSTCRSPTTARPCVPVGRRVARGAPRRGRHAGPLGRPDRPAHCRTPARCSTPPTRRRFRRRRSPPRTPTGCSAWPTAASRIVVRLKMEAHFERRRRVGQRRRRDSRTRDAGRSRRRQRPPRFVGRRRRRDRRWRRLRGDVGSAADHEEAEPAAAAHRARRAVDQRGERRPRRPRLSRSAPRRARQARDDAGVGRRRVPAARLRLHRQRRGARRRSRRSPRCCAGIGADRDQSPAAAAPTSARACRRRTSPACRSKSTARSTS